MLLAGDILLSVVAFGIFLVLRWDVIRERSVLNPDEAELLATGMRAADNLIPYENFTTSTFGVIAGQFLGALGVAGVPLNLLTLHALAALLAWGFSVFFFHLCRDQFGWRLAFLLGSPFLLMWAKGGVDNNSDFTHYSTELLPVALLALATLVYWKGKESSHLILMITLWLCQLAVLAKYQLLPIALYFAMNVLIRHARSLLPLPFQPLVWRLLVLVAAASLPVVAQLLLIVVTGNWNVFIEEGVLPVISYTVSNSDQLPLGNITSSSWPRDVWNAIDFALFEEPWVLIPFLSALLARSSVPVSNLNESDVRNWFSTRNAPIHLFFVAIISLSLGPNMFSHHLHLILIAGLIGQVIVGKSASKPLGAAKTEQTPLMRNTRWLPALLAASLALLSARSLTDGFRLNTEPVSRAQGFSFSDETARFLNLTGSDQRLAIDCPPNSRVLVFGWAAELYSYFDWNPASRYVVGLWQASQTPHQITYQRRLLQEVRDNQPDCILGASGPAFFPGGESNLDLLANVPGIDDVLAGSYARRAIRIETSIGSQILSYWILRP